MILHALLHFGLYAILCLTPALILLPVRCLDREPDNEIRHEQGDDPEDGRGEGDAGPVMLRAAALGLLP